MPFTQLSLQIWEDLDLWLPVDELYDNFDTFTRINLIEKVKRQKWSYITQPMRIENRFFEHRYLFSVALTRSIPDTIEYLYPYKIYGETMSVGRIDGTWLEAITISIVMEGNSVRSGDSWFQVLCFEDFPVYPISCIIVDIFPKPIKNRGPQVVT